MFGVEFERHDVTVMADIDDGVLKLVAAGEAGSFDLVPLARKLRNMRTNQHIERAGAQCCEIDTLQTFRHVSDVPDSVMHACTLSRSRFSCTS